MPTAPTESRFRVSVFFPLRHEGSYYKTLNWLTKRLNWKYEGVTLSAHQPLPVFRGFYFVERKELIKDRIVLLISDVEVQRTHEVEELEKALRPKVWLKSGGYIVINQTEALVAIDINTGKYVGKEDLEETAALVNECQVLAHPAGAGSVPRRRRGASTWRRWSRPRDSRRCREASA